MAIFTDRRELAVQSPVINRDFQMGPIGDLFYKETGEMKGIGKALSFIPGVSEVVKAAGVLGAKGADTKAVMRAGRDERWNERLAALKFGRDAFLTVASMGAGAAAGTATGMGAKIGASKAGQAAYGAAQKMGGSKVGQFIMGTQNFGSAGNNMLGGMSDAMGAVNQANQFAGFNRFGKATYENYPQWQEQQQRDLDMMRQMDEQQGLYRRGGMIKYFNGGEVGDPPAKYNPSMYAFEEDLQSEFGVTPTYTTPEQQAAIDNRLDMIENQVAGMTGNDDASIKRRMYNEAVAAGTEMLDRRSDGDAPVGRAAMSLLSPDTNVVGSAVNLIGARLGTMDAYRDEARERAFERRVEDIGEFNYLG